MHILLNIFKYGCHSILFYVIHTEHIHAYDYYYYTTYGVRLVVGGWVDRGQGAV